MLKSQSLVFTMPDAPVTVTDSGISELWCALTDSLRNDAAYWYVGFDSLWESVGSELVTRDGKIAKRIANYLFKNYQIRLPDPLVSTLGNIASQNAPSCNGEKYRVDFVTRKRDLWHPGDYGDHGSCYWGAYKNAPGAIMESGGCGFTVHTESGENVGRAWGIAPAPNMIALWNWYGTELGDMWSLRTLAALLTGALESPLRDCVYASRYLESRAYINGQKGIILRAANDVSHLGEYIDLGFDMGAAHECYSCGCEIDDDDALWYDGECYCEECYPIESCERCGRDYDREDGFYVPSESRVVCPRCYERHYTTCAGCNEMISQDDAQEAIGRWGNHNSYCSDCFDGIECAICSEVYTSDSIESVANGDYVCDSCLRAHYVECESCHVLCAHDDTIMLDATIHLANGRILEMPTLCPECYERHSCSVCHNAPATIPVSNGETVCSDCYRDDFSLFAVSISLDQIVLIE